jgi:hypothetical protein
LILALIQREDVQLTKLAVQLPGRALQSSKVKQLHRFFKNIRLSKDVLARFVLSFANPTERLWLVIDRTFLSRTDAHEDACPQLASGQNRNQHPAGRRDPQWTGSATDVDPVAPRGQLLGQNSAHEDAWPQ